MIWNPNYHKSILCWVTNVVIRNTLYHKTFYDVLIDLNQLTILSDTCYKRWAEAVKSLLILLNISETQCLGRSNCNQSALTCLSQQPIRKQFHFWVEWPLEHSLSQRLPKKRRLWNADTLEKSTHAKFVCQNSCYHSCVCVCVCSYVRMCLCVCVYMC